MKRIAKNAALTFLLVTFFSPCTYNGFLYAETNMVDEFDDLDDLAALAEEVGMVAEPSAPLAEWQVQAQKVGLGLLMEYCAWRDYLKGQICCFSAYLSEQCGCSNNEKG